MSMNIGEQSARLKQASAAQLPPDVAEVFDRNIKRMRLRGIPAGAVKVGDRLDSFVLNDAIGAPVTLDQLTRHGLLVMVFYRGGWCPYCNLALQTYQRELLPLLDAFQATLVAISPQTPTRSLSTEEKAGLDFEVFSDPGNYLARHLGIAIDQPEEVLTAQRSLGLDLAQVNDEASTILPMPTVLIVDSNRVVRFVDVQPDYTARTEVADILEGLIAAHAEQA